MKSWLEVSEMRRLLVFGVMGTLNSAVCYALFATLVHVFAWHYNAALVVDYGFGVMLGFALHRQATFADRTHLQGALAKYAATLGVVFLCDLAILNLLVASGVLGPLVAQAVAVVFVTTFSYLLQKHWVFRSHETRALAEPTLLGERVILVDERSAA